MEQGTILELKNLSGLFMSLPTLVQDVLYSTICTNVTYKQLI